jgi:response regulator RpfG family c-di-GMP phosphodiesterase
MPSPASPKKSIASVLVDAGVLTDEQRDRAERQAQDDKTRVEESAIELGFVEEGPLLKALSAHYETQFVSTAQLARAAIDKPTLAMIPKRVAEMFSVFPVIFDPATGTLSVVTADPKDSDTLRNLESISGARHVKAILARPRTILAAIARAHAGDLQAFARLEAEAQANMHGLLDVRGTQEPLVRTRPAPPPPPVERQPPPAPVAARPKKPDPPPRPIPRQELDAPFDAPLRPRAKSSPVIEEPAETFDLGSLAPPPVAAPPAVVPVARVALARAPAAAPALAPAPVLAPAAVPLALASTSYTLEELTDLLNVLISLLENTRADLRGHSAHVARLVKRVVERMNLGPQVMGALVIAAYTHDLGKMGQFHLTSLNSSEYDGHKLAAQKTFRTPGRLLEGTRFPEDTLEATLHMYERHDGKGFPDGLSGKEIPLGARILAITDTYADLTQNPRNPYRKALSPAEACGVLAKFKLTVFDPDVVDLFQSVVMGEDLKARLLADRYVALLIDPDPEETTVLELRMIEQGFDVKTARNAEQAIKMLMDTKIDLVVSEVELPQGDGIQLLADARQKPWGKDVAWVMHSRRQGRAEAQRAFELGVLDYVGKPTATDVLVAKLKARLDTRRSQMGTASQAGGVSGSLKEMGLPDMVQVLFHGRKSGNLKISSGTKSGEIHFDTGAVVNAIWGTKKGVTAFYDMIQLTDGQFALDPSFKPTERVINESAEALLLEGMRRMDEGLTG